MESEKDPRDEKGPGYIALISVCIARDEDEKVRATMPFFLDNPIEVKADTIDDLAIKISQYSMDAVVSISDPGPGNIAIAMHPRRG